MEIINIIIVNKNISGPKIDHWGTPRFIGKVYHCTSSSLTDCLQLVAYYCVRYIAVSSIPMAPGYLTDPFTLNNSVYDCHTCNCTNIPVKKYNLSLGQCIFAYKIGKLWDTIPECIQNASSAEIFKTHICLQFLMIDVHTCKHFMIDMAFYR